MDQNWILSSSTSVVKTQQDCSVRSILGKRTPGCVMFIIRVDKFFAACTSFCDFRKDTLKLESGMPPLRGLIVSSPTQKLFSLRVTLRLL